MVAPMPTPNPFTANKNGFEKSTIASSIPAKPCIGVRFDVSARSAPAKRLFLHRLAQPLSQLCPALRIENSRRAHPLEGNLNALSALGRSSVISRIPLLSLIVNVSICFFLGNE